MIYLKVKHDILSKNILIKYLNYYDSSFIAKYILVRPASIINLPGESFLGLASFEFESTCVGSSCFFMSI